MTDLQKAIKYLAVILASFLCAAIIGGALGILGLADGLVGSNGVADTVKDYPLQSASFFALDLQIGAAELKLQSGPDFGVKSNLRELTVEEKDGVLMLRDKTRFGASYNGAVVEITVPAGYIFEKVRLETGAGVVEIDTLATQNLYMELGAGKVTARNLQASQKAEIEGGAGALEIAGGSLANLEMELGVGKAAVKSRLTGKARIEQGVGEVSLTLLGTESDYTLHIEKGLGQALVGGTPASDGSVTGSGENPVYLEGGIGRLTVTFLAE